VCQDEAALVRAVEQTVLTAPQLGPFLEPHFARILKIL